MKESIKEKEQYVQTNVSGSVFSNKGEYNGTCNITRCETGLKATWYNHSTRKYYCQSCADRLNNNIFNKRDAMRIYGHDLCTKEINKTE